MKNIKAILILFAAVFTVALLLPGCGKPSSTIAPELEALFDKAGAIDEIYYEVISSVIGSDEVLTLQVWMKPPKLRVDTALYGQEMVMFADMDKKTGYIYLPEQGLANKMDFDLIPGSIQGDMEAIRRLNPVITGTEMLDGKDCTVVTYNDDGTDFKVWIWNDYGIPIRHESNKPDNQMVMEIKNIDFSPIPGSVFELPDAVLRSDWFETPAE